MCQLCRVLATQHSAAASPVPARRGRADSTILCVLDPVLLARITARRAELDALDKQLAKQLAEVEPSGTNSPSPKSLNG